jgi:putative ABC transport system permease protein
MHTPERALRDIDEEIRNHIELRVAELRAVGMSEAEAEREALRRFGDTEEFRAWSTRRALRRSRRNAGIEWISELAQDIRFALRQFRKAPSFTAIAVLTLALGIGANTAIFSVVNSVLLNRLPYENPGRLVAFVGPWIPPGELLEYQRRATSFTAIAAYNEGSEISLTGEGEPTRTKGATVTAELFSVLGARSALGRTFRPGEDRPGQDRVVVLSYGLWQQRFSSDADIIGQQIQLDGISRTVIGVMPRSFSFPSAGTQLWIPASINPADRIGLWSWGFGNVIARLRPGATVAQAAAEVGTLAPQMRELFPWNMPADWGSDATVVPLEERIVGNIRPTLLILFGAVGFVLLIACANVANLLLARTTGRQKEIAVRTALGAGRWRIVRQILTESLLLALIGGAAGLLLALWGVHLLTAGLPADTPRLEEIRVDVRVMGFALFLTLLTGLLFGVLPSLRAAGSGMQAVLKEGSRSGTSAGRRRLSGALVGAEIALAVVLVTGAGLLIHSFWQLLQIYPGFRAENVITATVAPPEFRYEDDASRREFYHELLQRLETLPGVSGVAVTSRLPFGSNGGTVFKIQGRPDPATRGGDWPIAGYAGTISEDYLRTMGIRLLRGRGFTDADRSGTPRVALISESLAREYWPGEDPIGERISGPAKEEWETIVGVVADVKFDTLTSNNPTALYRPLLQGSIGVMSVVAHTTADPDVFAANLRKIVASVDPDTPVDDIRTMEQLISTSVAQPRFTMLLLTIFATVALILGAVGIYGVIAYTVSQRTQEIGVRMALGASKEDVLRLVVRQGATLALIGVTIGLAAALATTRVLKNMLYGVSATDAATFTAVPLILMAVALLASYIPARRATRVDPVSALRAE